MTDYSEYGHNVFNSLARAALPPETAAASPDQEINSAIAKTETSVKEPKKVDNAANVDEPDILANTVSVPTDPDKGSSAHKHLGRPVGLTEQGRIWEPKPGISGPASSSLALVAVGPVKDVSAERRSAAVEHWNRKLRRLVAREQRLNGLLQELRLNIDSAKQSIEARRKAQVRRELERKRKLRKLELERFEQSFEFMLKCVAARNLHRRQLAARFQLIHTGLVHLSSCLRELYSEVIGDPLYHEYHELLLTNRKESQAAAHFWRRYLHLSLRVAGSLATNHDAWQVYNQVDGRTHGLIFYMGITKDVTVTLKDIVLKNDSEFGLSSTTIGLMSKLLQTNQAMLASYARIRGLLHHETFRQFFFQKRKSNIHWKQLDFWAPFESNAKAYHEFRSIYHKMYENIDDLVMSKASARLHPLMLKRWKPFTACASSLYVVMTEIDILQSELFEINWIRLKLGKLSGRHHANWKIPNRLSTNRMRFEKVISDWDGSHHPIPGRYEMPRNRMVNMGIISTKESKAPEKRRSTRHRSSSRKPLRTSSSAVKTEGQTEPEEIATDEIFQFSEQNQPFQPAQTSSPFPSYWSHKAYRDVSSESKEQSEEAEATSVESRDVGEYSPQMSGEPQHNENEDVEPGMAELWDGDSILEPVVEQPQSSNVTDTESTKSRVSGRRKGRRSRSPESSSTKSLAGRVPKRVPPKPLRASRRR